MGKVNAMASKEEINELSIKILDLKQRLNVTYNDLNHKLGKPCATSTLQNQARYKIKCTKTLFSKINTGIINYENNSIQKKLDLLRNEAISEINSIFDNYTKQFQKIISE